MTARPAYLDSIAVERERRMAGRATPDAHARVLWARALGGLTATSRTQLETARDFAMGIEYRHEGLDSAIYATHPLRVASFAVLSQVASAVEAGVVGLLHNVLEVSGVGGAELGRRFGDSVRQQIESLTVDRAKQWDSRYKRDYYAALEAGPVAARVVKVFDKLDNLYLLGLNADVDVKTRYAAEIASSIMPMVRRDMPSLEPYMTELLNETIVNERLPLATLQPSR